MAHFRAWKSAAVERCLERCWNGTALIKYLSVCNGWAVAVTVFCLARQKAAMVVGGAAFRHHGRGEWARGFYVKRQQQGSAQQHTHLLSWQLPFALLLLSTNRPHLLFLSAFVGGFGTVVWIGVAEYVAATPDTVATNHVEHTLQKPIDQPGVEPRSVLAGPHSAHWDANTPSFPLNRSSCHPLCTHASGLDVNCVTGLALFPPASLPSLASPHSFSGRTKSASLSGGDGRPVERVGRAAEKIAHAVGEAGQVAKQVVEMYVRPNARPRIPLGAHHHQMAQALAHPPAAHSTQACARGGEVYGRVAEVDGAWLTWTRACRDDARPTVTGVWLPPTRLADLVFGGKARRGRRGAYEVEWSDGTLKASACKGRGGVWAWLTWTQACRDDARPAVTGVWLPPTRPADYALGGKAWRSRRGGGTWGEEAARRQRSNEASFSHVCWLLRYVHEEWLTRVVDHVDALLFTVCKSFDSPSYAVVIDAYAVMDDAATLADKVQNFCRYMHLQHTAAVPGAVSFSSTFLPYTQLLSHTPFLQVQVQHHCLAHSPSPGAEYTPPFA
ncbi:unnamed protein product [Closterium sp. Naga37s-1]|nr:unnamed protein product [Closterium sp. Naga37s-1]